MKKILTTGQVARICNVAPRTVAKWFDAGHLPGYVIPESRDRRIPRENLIRFLKERGMPFDEMEAEEVHEVHEARKVRKVRKVLLVGIDSLIRSKLTEILGTKNFKMELAANVFDAGIRSESLRPDCIIIDFRIGVKEALMIVQNLRGNPDYAGTVLIGLVSDEDEDNGLERTLFDELFRKPFDIGLLAERIPRLLGNEFGRSAK